jgi:DNA-binding XRE family transcriptional regulator
MKNKLLITKYSIYYDEENKYNPNITKFIEICNNLEYQKFRSIIEDFKHNKYFISFINNNMNIKKLFYLYIIDTSLRCDEIGNISIKFNKNNIIKKLGETTINNKNNNNLIIIQNRIDILGDKIKLKTLFEENIIQIKNNNMNYIIANNFKIIEKEYRIFNNTKNKILTT